MPYWPRRVVLASGCLRTTYYVVGAGIVVELWAQSYSPGCTVVSGHSQSKIAAGRDRYRIGHYLFRVITVGDKI